MAGLDTSVQFNSRCVNLPRLVALMLQGAVAKLKSLAEYGDTVALLKLINQLYAVEDRTPRVCPWMNEPGGGIVLKWKLNYQPTVLIVFSIILFGFANTAVRS